ncbi:MAG: SDR family NAD(P)-dependent oxidoreductase [Pseudomonadota bacterium]
MDRRTMLGGVATAVAGGVAPSALAQPLNPTPGSPGKAGQQNSHSPGKKKIQVEGQTILVTGSNRGIGLGFVKVLLERGARRVYATARKASNLPDVVALDPDRVVGLELDVNNETQRLESAMAASDVTWLINNAGTPGSFTREERRIASASSLDDAKFVMQTNCWSPAEIARLFIPIILKNGGGAITNILSVGAWFCLPEYTSYSMSKSAAAIATAGLRAELDREPVMVAGVFTGGVQTRMSAAGMNGGASPEAHAREVLDAMAEGHTDVFAGAGSAAMKSRILEDPVAFERGVIERFHTNPLEIPPY